MSNFKRTSRDEDQAVYELIEDETGKLDFISKVFEELLSDEDITISDAQKM